MMKLNATMGTTVVPLLARLILCAAFLTMGWNKLLNDHTFHGNDARVLIDLGVIERPAAGGQVSVRASWQSSPGEPQPQPAPPSDARDRTEDAADEHVQEKPSELDEQDDEIEEPAPTPPPQEVEPPAVGDLSVTARRMHTVTLMVHKHDGPNPVIMAWIATMTELIGGALLLIGLFSRVWGLGLAVMMAVAFYMTTWPVLREQNMNLFAIAADMTGGYADFNRMYCQLGLFALALGVLLTGAGPVSLDRWLFRGSASPKIDEID